MNIRRRHDTILVVEDDEGLNNLIQKSLQALDYSTEGAFTGSEAVTKAMTGDYKLMLLDYRLQDMSGKQVIEALDDEGFKIPFIIVTGFGDEKIAVEMMKLGARDYIIKDDSLIDILPFRIERALKEISHEKIVATVDKVLEESETKLKSIFAASPTGIAMEHDRVFRWVSEKVVEMTGYSDGELLGESARMLYESEEEFERVGSHLNDDIEKTGRGEIDSRWRRKDGSIIDVYIQVSPLKPDDFDAGIIFSVLDISERKRMETELFNSKRDWEEVFNSVTDMITVHDKDFNIIRANDAAKELLELPLLEDMKAKCFKYYHGTPCAPEGCPSCNCLKTGKPATFEVFEPHLNKNIEIRSMPRFNKENKLIGLIHVVRDMTESKQAEESAKSFGNILETSLNEIYIFDAGELNFIQVNKGARKNLGYTMDELKKMTPLNLKPEFNKNSFVKLTEPLRSGEKDMIKFTTVHLRKDGTLYPVEVHMQFADYEAKPVFVAIVLDITERMRSEEMVQRQLKRINALHTIDIAITSSLDLRVTLDILIEQVMSHLDIDAVAVLLLNQASHNLEYYVSKGFRTSALKHTKLKIGESNAGKAVRERRIVTILDLKKNTDAFKVSEHFIDEDFVCYFAAPLIAKGEVKGVLELFNRSACDADDEWLEFFQAIATQAAIAIDDATLFEGLQRSNVDLALAYDATIEGWARALDLRDEETEGHSRRVTEITICIAHELGMKEEELVHVRRGALLHDIGKMGIPDSILLKPGKLTDDELKIMKKHPHFAHDMIYPIEYLRPAIDIPFSHHEKWDGTGYPNGLKGTEIPLAARIFAIVDVWDALMSDRPYRKAWPQEKVLKHLQSQSGTHFDPEILKLFLSWTCAKKE